MTKVTVPFEKKEQAKALGAFFDRTPEKRGWYLGDDLSAEQFYEGLNAPITANIPEGDTPNVNKAQPVQAAVVTAAGQTERVQSAEKAPDINLSDWNDVLNDHDTIKVVWAIKHLGMPDNEGMRVKILHALRDRGHGQYVVTYDSMCGYCDEFRVLYNGDRINDLASKYIRGENIYGQIAAAPITEEERELLYFIFPIRG